VYGKLAVPQILYLTGIVKHVCHDDISHSNMGSVTAVMSTSDHEKLYFPGIGTVYIH